MTKPREKTREELTAEIEDGKKKIRQFENREKIIKQKLSVEERKARNHRLIGRAASYGSIIVWKYLKVAYSLFKELLLWVTPRLGEALAVTL